MAAGYSPAGVPDSGASRSLAPPSAQPKPNDLVSRNVATLADTPKGQKGRPPKSLTLRARRLRSSRGRGPPVVELRPGIKDVQQQATLMHAYIV